MAVMARWRDMTWGVSPQRVLAVESLAFSYAQKADRNRAAEGSPPTNERGLEPFALNFSTVLHSNAGVNVEQEIERWSKLVTRTGDFFLNGKRLGPTLQLEKVNVGSTTLDDFGRIRLATLSFSFKEFDQKAATLTALTSALTVAAQTASKSEQKPPAPQVAAAPVVTIKVGSMVRPTGQRYASSSNKTIPQWVKDRSHRVSEMRPDRILLGWPDGISSWVSANEVTMV
jgi:hypothetical protein